MRKPTLPPRYINYTDVPLVMYNGRNIRKVRRAMRTYIAAARHIVGYSGELARIARMVNRLRPRRY